MTRGTRPRNQFRILQYGVEFLAVGTTGYFAVAMWRQRSQPTARSLLAVAVLLCLGAVAHVAVVHPGLLGNVLSDATWARNGGPLWIVPASVVVTLAGGFWFLFALQYTGRGGRLVPVATAGIGVFWLVLLGLALFGTLSPPPEARARTNAETVLFLGSFVVTILTVVGAALVLTTALGRNAVRFREALALAGGATVLGFVPVVSDTLLVSTVVPAMLAASSGLFALSVRRYPTFDAPPVARIAERIGQSYPDASVAVSTSGESATTRTDRDVLETVLEETIENAVEHNDSDAPRVELSVRPEQSGAVIEVRDDGPGIPERERSVLLEGEETPLRHGSGLGLWLVYWGITRLGGTLEFRENDPRGSVVSLRVPEQ